VTPLSGLSIIVPAFNEERTLEPVIADILGAAAGIARQFEILIIDDGSTDSTSSIALRLAKLHPEIRVLRHERNLGFGATQRTGFAQARLPFVTLVPADGQFPAGDLARFLPAIGDADIVLGYRAVRPDGLFRRVQSRVFQFLVRRVLRLPFRDVNWVKLYRREAIAGIELDNRRAGADAELLARALQRGARIKEVEVSCLPRKAGVASGSRPAVILKTAFELMRVWWRR